MNDLSLPTGMGPATVGIIFCSTIVLWILMQVGLAKLDLAKQRKGLFRWISAGILAGWFSTAVILGSLCVFCAGPDRFPRPPFPLLSGILFGLLVLRIPIVHRVFQAIPIYMLTAFLTTRFIGLSFLILYSTNGLPAIFALPLGGGDTFLGLTAPILAYLLYKFEGKVWVSRLAIGWNVLGIIDMMLSAPLGILNMTSVFYPEQNPNIDVITNFPMSLYASFAAPIVFVAHIYGLRHFARQKTLDTISPSSLP